MWPHRALTLILLTALSLVSSFAGDKELSFPGNGLRIETDPSGATVYLDGVDKGQTPWSISDLSPGRHWVTITKDDYWERRFQFTSTPGTGLYYMLELEEAKGILRIVVLPSSEDADLALSPAIKIDGQTYGGDDIALLEGYHLLQVGAFGYQSLRKTIYIERGQELTEVLRLDAASFSVSPLRLARRLFSPAYGGILGRIACAFSVSTAGKATLLIKDEEGKTIRSIDYPTFQKADQVAQWDGRDEQGNPVGDGSYSLILEARGNDPNSPVIQRSATVRVDNKLVIPLDGTSPVGGGFIYTPSATPLPFGTIIMDGYALVGETPLSSTINVPFSLAFRYAPLSNLEIWANAHGDGTASTGSGGISLGAKAQLSPPELEWLSVAALGRWAYERSGTSDFSGDTSFGASGGVELSVPLEVKGGGWRGLLVPGLLWKGADGRGDFTSAPRPTLAGGIGWEQRRTLLALSSRTELDLTSIEESLIVGALELRRSLNEESLVLTGSVGLWEMGGENGLFCGAGFGFRF